MAAPTRAPLLTNPLLRVVWALLSKARPRFVTADHAREVNMSNDPNPTPVAKSRPVEEIRLGAIKAAVWRNDTDSGVRHNVTFERIYRDGEEWRSTGSFGKDDLLVLAKVADQAHTWILTTGRSASAAQPSPEAEPAPLTGAEISRRRR